MSLKASLSNLLNKIDGPKVQMVGFLGASASIFLYGRGHLVAIFVSYALLLIFDLTSASEKFRSLLTKTVGKFAKVPGWPQYVSLAIIILIAAYHGHVAGLAVIAFVLATGVGVLFDELY